MRYQKGCCSILTAGRWSWKSELLVPAWPADCPGPHLTAVLKRTGIMVCTKHYITARPAGENAVYVNRIRVGDKKDVLRDSSREKYDEYRKGIRDAPAGFQEDVEWEQRWLRAVLTGEGPEPPIQPRVAQAPLFPVAAAVSPVGWPSPAAAPIPNRTALKREPSAVFASLRGGGPSVSLDLDSPSPKRPCQQAARGEASASGSVKAEPKVTPCPTPPGVSIVVESSEEEATPRGPGGGNAVGRDAMSCATPPANGPKPLPGPATTATSEDADEQAAREMGLMDFSE